jgi:hypothetical protein
VARCGGGRMAVALRQESHNLPVLMIEGAEVIEVEEEQPLPPGLC